MALSISNLKRSSGHYQSSLSAGSEMAEAPPYPPPLPMQLQQYEDIFTSTPRKSSKNLSLRQLKAGLVGLSMLLLRLRRGTKNIVSRGYKFVLGFSFKAKRYCIQYYTFVSPAVLLAVTFLRVKSKLVRLNRPPFLSSKFSKKLSGIVSARLQKTRNYVVEASYMPHKAFTAVGITAVTAGLTSSLFFSITVAIILMSAGIIQLILGIFLKNKIHLRS